MSLRKKRGGGRGGGEMEGEEGGGGRGREREANRLKEIQRNIRKKTSVRTTV